MSNNNSLINLGVGIALGVATYFTFGATAALFAFSIGATASALILGPDKLKGESQRPDTLEINQSSENTTIPVIFGTSRVPGNFIRVGFDEFTSVPIRKKGKGKKAPTETIGMRYYFPLSYGICMGKIDRLNKILGSPGLDRMTSLAEDGLSFAAGTPEIFTIIHQKDNNGTVATEGGSATFYPGSGIQGSDATTVDRNHRGVCWVDFASYQVDGSPAPRTLLFEIFRLPVVADAAGTPLDGFPLRAAANPSHSEYNDANPAAIAWEVLTDKQWGKGMSPDRLDEASFRAAATYYQTTRLGMSTALGRTSLNSFIQRLRDLFGLLIWWDGEFMRAVCLWDRGSAYQVRRVIKADDVIGEPQFQRPSSTSSFNEIRLEFTNRENNWQQESATAMDLANAQTIAGIRSQTVDGAEIGTRRAAELIAHQILRQMAYPAATCTIGVRRTYSDLQPGSFIQFVWDEWRETGLATTYWRVVDVEDDDQAGEGLTITMMEDLYATAHDGDRDFTTPFSDIEADSPLTNEDLALADLTTDQAPGAITPIVLWDPNIFVTGATKGIMVLPSRRKAIVQTIKIAWNNLGEGTTNQLPTGTTMPINGTLLDAIPATGPKLGRGTANQFRIQLYVAADAPKIEEATGLVQTDSDDFSALLRTTESYLLVNGEIFRIGDAEETAPGVVTIKTFVRAELATKKALHAIGSVACFLTDIENDDITPSDNIPTATAVELRITPQSSAGITDPPIEVFPTSGLGVVIAANSIRPFPPEILGATRVGTTWTVTIRPRMWATGAGTSPSIDDDMAALVSTLEGLSLRFQKGAAVGGIATLPADRSFTSPPFTMPAGLSVDALAWQPDDGMPGNGTITIQITFDVNPTNLSIWSVRDGFISATPLNVPQPA